MLNELISLLNKDELKGFRVFLKQRNKRGDTKNLALLDSLMHQKTDDKISLDKLYDRAQNRDAYHALRKRMSDNLLHFMADKVLASANGEVHEALRLLLLSRYLLENDLPKIAFKCLSVAEKKAVELEQFSMLNEIYLAQIQYAHLFPQGNLETLTGNLLRNQSNIQREAKLHIVYAILRRELNEIHLDGKIVDLSSFIQDVVSRHGVSFRELLTYKSLYQILYIVNAYAAIQQDYSVVAIYVKTSLRFLNKECGKTDQQLFYHLNILYYLANFALRSRYFEESLAYLKDMTSLLAEKHMAYRSVFELRIQLLQGLNLHFQGMPQEAMEITRKALSQIDKRARQEEVDDLHLSYIMMLTHMQDKRALKEVARFSHSNAWYEKRLGMLWTIRKNVLEILIQAQFGNVDVSLSLITSFKKRYKRYLEQTKERRVLEFVSLVAKYVDNPLIAKEKVFNEKVQALLVEEESRKDLFTISFLSWLLACGRKESSYEVMLTLI